MSSAPELDVHLRFPAERGYLRLSRINATTIAADLDFDVEALDDLRLAVDEAVNWLVSGPEEGEALLHLSAAGGSLRIEGTCSEPSATDPGVDDLVHAVLGATVDHYEIGLTDGGHRRVALIKNATA